MQAEIVVIGYLSTHNLFEKVLADVQIPEGINISFPIIEDIDQLDLIPQMAQVRRGHGVVICGFKGAKAFRRTLPAIQIMELRPNGFDILRSIKEALVYQQDEIVMLNYYEEITEFQELTELLHVPVRQLVYNSAWDLELILKDLQGRGCKVVLGTSFVCDNAEKYGIICIFLYTEAMVREALNNAISLLTLRAEELQRFEYLNTILEYVDDGLIGANNQGIITLVNPSAERLLGMTSEELIDQPINNIFKGSNVSPEELQTKPRIEQLVEFQGNKIICSFIPIVVEGFSKIQLVVLQDVNRIQSTEHSVRRKLHCDSLRAKYEFHDIMGNSFLLRKTVEKAKKFSVADSAVLISGETGTGKELFAHSIHNRSKRKEGPFIAINCAAMPENLLDSELFGYEEGAFTGAKKGGKMGLFELAHGGTIFLDEIGELSLSLQAHLLRVLQNKEVFRIGGNKYIPVDVRVISATNRDLDEEVKKNNFREDLYFRLGVLQITVPPLRERKEDIEQLIKVFMKRANPLLYNVCKKYIPEIVAILSQSDWRGNIRELENFVERFVALTQGESLDKDIILFFTKEAHFTFYLNEDSQARNYDSLSQEGDSLDDSVKDAEIRVIQRVLIEMGGNKTETAKKLGISRATLWRKLQSPKGAVRL